MKNKNLVITALLGLTTVVFGAFGAHVLKSKISPELLITFETGIRYQMYHVFVLLFINMYTDFSTKLKNNLSLFFFLGILCFSGSLYAISVLGFPAKNIWFITPLGGLFFIIGWFKLAISFFKGK
ncbi:MAG: DUF423 domain-containing protein [Flavobacteriaceae bacterium]|nr:DUF423 domain-containing protein [Flavobacteriaceae bacterium]